MLRAQLQASYDEQEILVQHQSDLLAERDHSMFPANTWIERGAVY